MAKKVKKRNIIQVELRKGVDDDIADSLEKSITKEFSKSSIVRSALRQYLLQKNYSSNHPIEFSEAHTMDVELSAVEKDDTQLDVALDNLLNF